MKSDLISKLNAKTSNMSGSTGGFGSLTTSDIAHSLAGLKGGAYQLGYAIHGDQEARQALTDQLYSVISDKVNQDLGHNYIKALCQIAVHEEVGESKCLECGGRGVVYRTIEAPDEAKHINEDGLLPVDCTASRCVDGSYRMTDMERWTIIGEAIDKDLTRQDWQKGICWDYSEALSQLADWRNKLESHISRRLADED